MERRMINRLVFSFYLYPGWDKEYINNCHLHLIEYYASRFDKATICLNIGDGVTREDIQKLQKQFIRIFKGKNLELKEYQNTELRETNIFYNEIALKLKDLDGLTFFAHNKGITEAAMGNDIIKWISGLYYFSLEFMDDVYNAFGNQKLCYGSFPQSSPWETTKWFYGGTFFWINGNGLYEYMQSANKELPLLDNRWYDEFFLGRLMDINSFLWGSLGYYMPYYDMNETLYLPIDEKIKQIYPYQYETFNIFYQTYAIKS